MADKNDESDPRELEEQEISKKPEYSNEDSCHLELIQKSQQSSPFASPFNKRPFAHCSEENEKRFGKRTKYNCDLDLGRKSTAYQKSTNEKYEGKTKLMKILKSKEDVLRKLNLVKMYRAKNNLSNLEDLIHKWRSISQAAAQDLFEKFNNDKVITMGQFLDGMRISRELIKYSEEEETFY